MMQQFLQHYIRAHSLTSITSVQLRSTWENWVQDNYSAEETNAILASIAWETWLYKSELELPGDSFVTAESVVATNLALNYIALNGTASPENYKEYFTFYSNLKVVFYDTLQANYEQINDAILAKIDADYNATEDLDPEVRQRWYPLCLYFFYPAAYSYAEAWVGSLGRLKYLTPVYNSLEISGQHDLGVQWYQENYDFYTPITQHGIEKTLHLDIQTPVKKDHPETARFIQ